MSWVITMISSEELQLQPHVCSSYTVPCQWCLVIGSQTTQWCKVYKAITEWALVQSVRHWWTSLYEWRGVISGINWQKWEIKTCQMLKMQLSCTSCSIVAFFLKFKPFTFPHIYWKSSYLSHRSLYNNHLFYWVLQLSMHYGARVKTETGLKTNV